jgi:hypothetical protein
MKGLRLGKTLLPAFLLALLLTPTMAPAQDQAGTDSLPAILKQQQELSAKLDKGSVEGLTARQVSQIRKAQKEVFAVTDGKQSLDQMSIDDKVKMENALERINAEMVNTRSAKDGKEVCWRERVSGSTVKKTRCGTEAEMREAREGARDYLERPKVCAGDCGGS